MTAIARTRGVRLAQARTGTAALAWWRREGGALTLLVIAALALFLIGLGQGTLWDQDEPRYASMAREMVQSKDFLTLRLNGQPWFVHPPLYMWLQAVTGWLFGFNEFTARVWSAIFGTIGVSATYLLGRDLFNRRTAVLGAIVLMTMLQYFAQSRLAIFDVPLVVFMLLATYAFVRGVRDDRPRLILWAAAWAGLGTLTKGPIALVLPALVLAAFYVTRDGTLPWRRIPWIPAALIYCAIGLPWYLVEWVLHGWGFVRSVFGYYTFGRFFGAVEGQSGPWWYYAPVFGVGAFPWTAFLLAMIPYHLRRRQHDGSRMVLSWCGVTVIFFTIAGTKLPNYVLPVYPFAALGIAAVWDRFLSGEDGARRYINGATAGTALALIVLAAEVAAFARMQYPGEFLTLQRHFLVLSAVVGGWLLAALLLHVARQRRASFAAVAGTTVLLAILVTFWTMPIVEARRPVKSVAAVVRPQVRPGVPLIAMGISDLQTLMYYTNFPVQYVDSEYRLATIVCYQTQAVVVTRPTLLPVWLEKFRLYGELSLHMVAHEGDLVVLRKETPTRCRQPLLGR